MTRLHRPALAALAPWRVRVGGLWMGRVVSLVVSLVASLAPHAAAAQALPALQLLSPRPGEPATTTRDHVHVLGRTLPGATVRVAGEAVTVFATGVFARDRVPLQPGANTLVIEASLADGQSLRLPLQVERMAPPAAPAAPQDRLWLDTASLRPAEAVMLAPGEAVEVAVRATPGQQVQARLPGQRSWQPLIERGGSGRYRALLAFSGDEEMAAAPVQVRLLPAAAAGRAPRPRARAKAAAAPQPASINATSTGSVGLWRPHAERLFVTGADGAELLHGLHEVRLGGPYLAELPPARCWRSAAGAVISCACSWPPTPRPGWPRNRCCRPSPAHQRRRRCSPVSRSAPTSTLVQTVMS